MAIAYRRRTRPARPPEIAFLTTIAVVSLFTLYSFGKDHVGYEYHDATRAALTLRSLQQPDKEVRGITPLLLERANIPFSVVLFTMFRILPINAPSFERTVLMKKLVSSHTFSCIIVPLRMQSRSPLRFWCCG